MRDNCGMPVYRDSHGRTLADYPRPSVAVDTAVLSVPADSPLSVLLVGGPGHWRLPGTFLHEGETLADAVLRSLRDKAGVTGLSPEQLYVYDDPTRDERGWVLSVAHVDAVHADGLIPDAELARLFAVAEVPRLPFGHESIIKRAVAHLRERYASAPDPAGFLIEPFPLRALQSVHEAVAGVPLPRDSFRRSMEHALTPTGASASGSVGKPARLFTRGRGEGARVGL